MLVLLEASSLEKTKCDKFAVKPYKFIKHSPYQV